MDDWKLIYFIGAVSGEGPIKIGCSCYPQSRLLSFQAWTPVKLQILAVCKGRTIHERKLHQMFREDNSHGEWFHRSNKLLKVIENVNNGNGLPRFRLPKSFEDQGRFLAGRQKRSLEPAKMAVATSKLEQALRDMPQ